MSISETKEKLALYEKLCPFTSARGPGVVWKDFDPSSRKFSDLGMDIEYNHTIPARDSVELRADIYMPQGRSEGANLPVVLAITPYGKQNPVDLSMIPPSKDFNPGFDGIRMSKYAPFEGSDPWFWTRQGFAYVVVDARGSFASGGSFLSLASKLDGLDGYDVVEYLGTRPWSNGRVGMIGASALGMIQWQAASNRPPHLGGIIVQDASTDMYRDVAFKGGILHKNFMTLLNDFYLAHGNDVGSRVVALSKACETSPFYDDFWKEWTSVSNIAKITCPVYVITSLADNGIHTPGSIRGYLATRSEKKFLEMHPYLKWEWQVTPESLERQAAFFNKVLDGPDPKLGQSVDFWAPVRLHVTEKHYAGSWRSENEFPIARTQRTKFYLGQEDQLLPDSVSGSDSVVYDAKTGSVAWQKVFTSPTEITGTSRLHLTLSISSGSDADLFVTLQKLDRDGNAVLFPYHSFINDGYVAWGWLEASKRKLAEHPFGDEVAHTFLEKDAQPLTPGEKVQLDIGIQPTATLFRKGEAIRLVVQGRDFNEYGPYSQISRAGTGCNEGQHKIFLDGSYVELPIIPYKFG